MCAEGSKRVEVLDRQPCLKGELVELRPLVSGDFDVLYAIASDPLLWEQHPSKERTQRHVFQQLFDDGMESGGALVVHDRADGRIIGTSRFGTYHPEQREVEIGWTFLARSHWGGPYNAETKRLMLEHAFGCVEYVIFRVHSLNFRSQRAVDTLGALRVGVEPDRHGRGENYVFRLDAKRFASRTPYP